MNSKVTDKRPFVALPLTKSNRKIVIPTETQWNGEIYLNRFLDSSAPPLIESNRKIVIPTETQWNGEIYFEVDFSTPLHYH